MSKMDEDLDQYRRELERLLKIAEEREKIARQLRARELLDRARAAKMSPLEISTLLKTGLDAFIYEVVQRETMNKQQKSRT